ncbi:MAG: sigma 54-dependent Fis family transcriptional regulator [Labilithrix sp.]|nr:sigma 54-dependent Fis family transcriptional regulator [Labilithrix sp.]MCW5816249.1 sigma 54-dependent Fis family transcriptional regulator [Labilithrix sp.]
MSSRLRGTTIANPPVVPRTTAVPKLIAVTGPSKGASFAVVRSSTTVGRHPTNDFVVDDPRVSAAHLELTRNDDRVRVRDVGSTNGTWLGAHRVADVELAIGGEITIGDTLLRVDVEDAAPPMSERERESFGEIVGRSKPMRELFSTLDRIAPLDLAILLQGETGSGKEEIARAIHAASPRANKPFVVIDTSAIPDELAEPMLFGEAAAEIRVGLFESAHGGSVFIDGIAELSSALQTKILRILERREVLRVGGSAPVPIDVRVLSASRTDVRNAIERGLFREDLYHRLAQVRVVVPPLRQRKEDFPLICAKLLARAGSDVMIDVDALELFASLPWPGNVRELNNALLRAAAIAQGGVIRRGDFAGEGNGFRGTASERDPLDLSGTFSVAKDRAIERFEKAYLTLLMKSCRGNLSAASRQADIARHHLRDLLKKRGLYGVSLEDKD